MILGRLLLFLGLLASASAASACSSRDAFFSSSGEGQVALLRDATSRATAKSVRSNWCPLSRRIYAPRDELWFGIDNRLREVERRYALVKVFRRSPATVGRPRAFLWRIGTWSNARCGTSTSRARFLRDIRSPRYSNMFAELAVEASMPCSPVQEWRAFAFGDRQLDIASEYRFLGRLPRGISVSGQVNWQLQVVAFSYATSDVEDSMFNGDFNDSLAVFRIARFEAEEAWVQIQISDGRYKEFRITW